jgi:type VI secretion system protein ImpM
MPPAPPAIPAGDIFAALGIAPPPAAAPLAPAQLVQGLFGKLPVHGDFIQRGLPRSFRDVWDHWLTRGISAARQELGPRFDAAWNNAPAWRFALPAGACGPDPVAGVMVTSSDTVGRQFPLAAVALQPGMTEAIWAPEWFAALEGVVLAGRAGLLDADAMAAALPRPGPVTDPALAPPPGWWTAASATRPGLIWPLPALPAPEEFALLLESEG